MAKDEEYHFKDAESPVSYTTGPSQLSREKDLQAAAKRRKIISMVLISFLLWGVYKLISLFLTETKKNPTPAVVTTKPPTVTKPIATAPPPTLTNEQLQEAYLQKKRLDNLEEQVVNLQSSIADTNTKLSDLSSQISELSAQITKPTPPRPLPTVAKKRIRSIQKIERPRVSYTLQAVLPGRAWLRSSAGNNLTVTIGDKVPGYGVVVDIDTNSNLVQTSSGAIIKYR